VSGSPGALIFVEAPPGSTTVTLERVQPPTGTCAIGTSAAASIRTSSWPSGPPKGMTARDSMPNARSARVTFTPLPPGSMRTVSARFTPPRRSRSTSRVRSRLGLSVSVTIMRAPPGSRRG